MNGIANGAALALASRVASGGLTGSVTRTVDAKRREGKTRHHTGPHRKLYRLRLPHHSFRNVTRTTRRMMSGAIR